MLLSNSWPLSLTTLLQPMSILLHIATALSYQHAPPRHVLYRSTCCYLQVCWQVHRCILYFALRVLPLLAFCSVIHMSHVSISSLLNKSNVRAF